MSDISRGLRLEIRHLDTSLYQSIIGCDIKQIIYYLQIDTPDIVAIFEVSMSFIPD